jgi:hypothetical protein
MNILSKLLRWITRPFSNKRTKVARDLQDTLAADPIENPDIKPELEYPDPVDTECVAEVEVAELLAVFQYIKKHLPGICPCDLQHHVTIVRPGVVRAVWSARNEEGKKYIGLISECLRRFIEWKGPATTTVKLLGVAYEKD